MKKIVSFLSVVFVVFSLIIIINNISQKDNINKNEELYGNKELKPETIAQLDDPNYQNIILPTELEKKLLSEEDVFVYFYSPTCSHCLLTTPKIMKIGQEKKIRIEQFNLHEFGEEGNKYNIDATPTLVKFHNGKEVNRIIGEQKKEVFIDFIGKL